MAETRRSPCGCLEGLSQPSPGFALVAVLVLLAALYLGTTGLFLAARAELRIGLSHVASGRALYLAEAGLATWLSSPVQPSIALYEIDGDTVEVAAVVLIRVDSLDVLYRLRSRVTVGGASSSDPTRASREISRLGLRRGSGPVVAVRGTLREIL